MTFTAVSASSVYGWKMTKKWEKSGSMSKSGNMVIDSEGQEDYSEELVESLKELLSITDKEAREILRSGSVDYLLRRG
jgi:hypothetical protein